MNAQLLICLVLAAALGGFTQGFAGFGSTVVALPLMVLTIAPKDAVPAACLMALCLNVAMVARLRDHVEAGALKLLLVASLPGMAVGAWLIGVAPQALLRALLGASVLLLALQSLTRPKPASSVKSGWVWLAGLAAGCLGVCIGINGPPVVAWASRRDFGREALKATLTSYFLISGVLVVGVQAAKGLVTADVLTLFAVSLPAVLLGLWAGEKACGRVGDAAFKRAVAGLLAATGALLVWQAVRAVV